MPLRREGLVGSPGISHHQNWFLEGSRCERTGHIDDTCRDFKGDMALAQQQLSSGSHMYDVHTPSLSLL